MNDKRKGLLFQTKKQMNNGAIATGLGFVLYLALLAMGLELPADAPVGKPLADYLGLPDASIELKLTPNRPDCLGLVGLALTLGGEDNITVLTAFA